MKKGNALILNKKFIDDEIVNHFKFSGMDNYFEKQQTEFEASFKFKRGESTYQILVPYGKNNSRWGYDKNHISVTDQNGVEYSCEDGSLVINNNSINPASLTMEQEIENLIEHEENKRIDCKPTIYDWNKGIIIQ